MTRREYRSTSDTWANIKDGATGHSQATDHRRNARIRWAVKNKPPKASWLEQMLERKPRMLVAIALANKTARTIWAMMTKHEDYRDPVAAA